MMRLSAFKQVRPRPSLVVRHATMTAAPRAAPRALSTAGGRLVGLGGFTVTLAVAIAASNGTGPAGCEASSSKSGPSGGGSRDGASILDDLKKFLGLATDSEAITDKEVAGKKGGAEKSDDGKEAAGEKAAPAEEELANEGPGKRVKVDLDPELVSSLPVMPLAEVKAANGLGGVSGDGQRLLASYEGIVYDITSFAQDHPGGRELLRTAAGLDLGHFFANYTVHGETGKAAAWLAPLAVAKLTPEDAAEARLGTTPERHVERRMALLGRARRKVLAVASTLPFWMLLRQLLRALSGCGLKSLARKLADALPLGITVPGLTSGSEPLDPLRAIAAGQAAPTVAVIGGGVAGCGAAWALKRSGFSVQLFEARAQVSGNARTFDWDFREASQGAVDAVKSCVSVTAWPPGYYKNYTALLKHLAVETVPMPLSWFLNSKVPGAEGTLWAADPTVYEGSLRKVFEKDFRIYRNVERFASKTTDFMTLSWLPWKRNDKPSMYANHTGLGLLNPLNVIPLYSLFKVAGGSDLWWDVVFTPHYTASFLVDELRPFPAVFGPLIEAQIPLNPLPSNAWQGKSAKGAEDCFLTTCVTWKDAGKGIRQVFAKLVEGVETKQGLRVRSVEVLANGKKRVHDENDGFVDVDRVVFACPANAVGNILKAHGPLEEAILNAPSYADDHHPSTGHMHAVMHSDAKVIPAEIRDAILTRASNYVEVTRLKDGSINIENQYNFGVQTPGPGVYDMPLNKKPVMLISHALGEGKAIDPALVRGTGNHARAHPLYSGWNVMAQLSLRLVQGRDGVYYCSNWTTPGNCHDMSLLSGFIAAHAIGAAYPFPDNKEARKDFDRLRDLMGV